MFENNSMGIWSLLPLIVALILAFKTKSAAFSLFAGCLVGVVLLGLDPAYGFNRLAQESLGNQDFIWLCLVIIFIGILFGMFKKAGVVNAFARKISRVARTRRGVQFTSWLLGLFIIDDYFSPLITGTMIRPVSDKTRISREKLAFILDATTASVCILVPFTAWGVYLASLIAAQKGPVTTADQSLTVFIQSIPYNFYSIFLLIFTLGICLKLIPDFGPMKKAETRASETGKVLRDGAEPLIATESEGITEETPEKAHLIADLLVPVLILFGIAIGTFVLLGKLKIAEAFITTVLYMGISLYVKRQVKSIQELMTTAMNGFKDVLPTLVIIALAYSINTVTKGLGAADFIFGIAKGGLTPSMLVALAFLITAVISFSTGTSWGAYALMIPLVLPLAYEFTGGALEPLVYKTIAAVSGGGIFGDHASPVSDTSVLSSAGAGSDHMDHVITQLPYALTIAGITFILYIFV